MQRQICTGTMDKFSVQAHDWQEEARTVSGTKVVYNTGLIACCVYYFVLYYIFPVMSDLAHLVLLRLVSGVVFFQYQMGDW